MAEQKYRVVGTHTVAGIKPGGIVTLPAGVNARALVKGGHIKPVAAKKPAEDDQSKVDQSKGES